MRVTIPSSVTEIRKMNTYTERLALVLMVIVVLIGFQSCLKPAGLSQVMNKVTETQR